MPEVGPQHSAPVSEHAVSRNGSKLVGLLVLLRRRPQQRMANLLHNLLRLDYVSCVLTILATVLLGRKLWQGWVVAAVNSAVVCIIGVRTAQFGFVPANLLCIALYTSNLVTWRLRLPDRADNEDSQDSPRPALRRISLRRFSLILHHRPRGKP